MFNKSFGTISKSLFNQGKIKFKYTPYNLRDTYIDNAWQMVEDGLISTLEVGVITGNSATVAAKHYRNRENTKRYVEALYKRLFSKRLLLLKHKNRNNLQNV
ncbi:hypothetical protein LSPCS325_19090 [Lysinibacillus sp. CTST325]